MKLFCDQKDLSYALNIVNKAISPNNTLPVLNNILLKAENKKLYLSATNLELAISLFIDADVRNEGSVTSPARLLTNYISLLKDEKVELTLQEGLSLLLKTKPDRAVHEELGIRFLQGRDRSPSSHSSKSFLDACKAGLSCP